jgi:transposase
MNAYSEDLRKKIVAAVERGMPKIEAARTFGVGISSIKRYVGHGTPRKVAGPEEASWLQAQDRRGRKEALGGRPRRAPGGNLTPEA